MYLGWGLRKWGRFH